MFHGETELSQRGSRCISRWSIDVGGDQLEDFGWRKRLRQRPDSPEFHRFSENRRSAVRGDQHNRHLRLDAANARDHLKARDIGKEQIDDAEHEAPAPRLVNSVVTVGRKHNLITLRLQHKLQRIAYRRFVVNNQNTHFFVYFSTAHNYHTFLYDFATAGGTESYVDARLLAKPAQFSPLQ